MMENKTAVQPVDFYCMNKKKTCYCTNITEYDHNDTHILECEYMIIAYKALILYNDVLFTVFMDLQDLVTVFESADDFHCRNKVSSAQFHTDQLAPSSTNSVICHISV